MPAYPTLSIVAAALVVLYELAFARTGIFRTPAYWIAMAVVTAFQIPVDGWMTKLSDPIVIYNRTVLSGWRWPLDIPTEEFVYAWAMLTLVIVLWERSGRREAPKARDADAAAGATLEP